MDRAALADGSHLCQVRAHTGMESQRHWSDKAIARTTPYLFGIFSLVTLLGADLHRRGKLKARAAAWYRKEHIKFSDTIAAVRQQVWAALPFSLSPKKKQLVEIPRDVLERLTEALCYAAWSDWAIARTTPCLLALFSIVTLLAGRLVRGGKLPVRVEAWYLQRTSHLLRHTGGAASPPVALRFPTLTPQGRQRKTNSTCDALLTGGYLLCRLTAKLKLRIGTW